MVIRGKPRGNGVQLAGYLMMQADNDNVRVFDIRGTSQLEDLKASLLEMSLTAELTKSERGLYHAQINPAYGEDKQMKPQDWLKAADILGEELQLKDQKRIIVLHEKKGRTHAHVVWERYDHEKEIMISDSHSRLAQDRARKTIEQELSQTKTPHRNASRPEMKKTLTELWQKTITGKEFIKEALNKGYTIAKGQLKRPFMVIDNTGRSFDLTRQLREVKTKEVRDRLKHENLRSEKDVINEIRSKEKMVTKEISEEPAIICKPGLWVDKYEVKQSEMLQEEKERLKAQFKKELLEQLQQQRNLANER